MALTAALSWPEPVGGANSTLPEKPANLAATVVRKAQRLALRQLKWHPACRELFEELGHSGLELVSDATFRIASPAERREICRRRKGALFTTVNGSEITICQHVFVWHSARAQAALLLHEALHHAGMSERPADPNGRTPLAITRLVKRKCGL